MSFDSKNRLPRHAAVDDNEAMLTDPPNAEPPQRKRRWFQFSLRTLMIFTTVVAVGAAWLVPKIERKRRERDAVKAIESLGGIVWYDYQFTGYRSPPDSNAPPPGPYWLRNLFGEHFIDEVAMVSLCANVTVSDAGLVNVKSLPQLQSLNLGHCHITDAGLEHLKGLTHLQGLALGLTNVTDAGLEHLKGLTQLRYLGLQGTRVADAGLVNLKGLSQLQTLDMVNTDVTDAGLEYIKSLTQLQTVDLCYSLVTDDGVKDLRKALPNCKINH
jgi:Leucine rich repeat